MTSGAPNGYWRADGSWNGRTVVIVGGGPSVTTAQVRAIGLARAADRIRVIAINDAVYPCWFADIVWGCDARWWRYHGTLPGFSGIKLALTDTGGLPPGVMLMKNTGEEGFDPDPWSVRTGRNGGYQALHVAVHMGATTVLLVGYDMQGQHWFGRHPAEVHPHAGNPAMHRRIYFFARLAPLLKERGVRVVNVTPGSALDAFERDDLETELRRRNP